MASIDANVCLILFSTTFSLPIRSLYNLFIFKFSKIFLLSFSSILKECFLRIAQPLLLARVIRYFANDPEITYYDACWSTAGVVGCTMMFITIHHPTMLQAMRIGMKMRISCSGLMYQKALLLSKISTNQTAIGQIINIMSNDMNRMDNVGRTSIQFSFKIILFFHSLNSV